MCGIIGVLGRKDVVPTLIGGLKRLEYRGYDSAGIAVLAGKGIERRRAKGKIAELEARLSREPLAGDIGIGHTRWATHGVANEENAHPHATSRLALVHNGIIENYQELAAELSQLGHRFASETDTEIAAHLISGYLDEGLNPEAAVVRALARLRGAFAFAVLFAGQRDLLIGARRGSPLVVGWGEGEMFLGSDVLALAPLTEKITYLEDGDWVVLKRQGAVFYDASGQAASRPVKRTAASGAATAKGNYRHYMQKEIFEQPSAIGQTLNTMFNPATRSIRLPPLPFDIGRAAKATMVACGTSYYAAMVGKYWFEQLAGLGAEADIASEFRYRAPPLDPEGLGIFISQSGETIDTLAAMRHCKARGQRTLAVVNVPESAMAREADAALYTHAGPEIGVASTKAFTCQLVTLACLAIALAKMRGAISHAREAELSAAIAEVPARAAEVLNHDERLRELAEAIAPARDVLYIGRGLSFPIALEGALKLKEISYIHAEGYAGGELKHGPIALIDDGVPVIVVAPMDGWFEKTLSNVQQVIARGGKAIVFSDQDGIARLGKAASFTVTLPACDPFVAPILYAIPVQLLAYHTAILKGTDVDQPRNLAKSVTVE
jgi:glucosamine--fructose-6-phosphate aminotransferase (isomerizing)